MNTPSSFLEYSQAFFKIRELKNQFPNDQDLGRQLRSFLNELEESSVKQNDIEIDKI